MRCTSFACRLVRRVPQPIVLLWKGSRRPAARKKWIAAGDRLQVLARWKDRWRGICARKAKKLSSTDTLENNPHPEAAEAALDIESSHEGHESHDDQIGRAHV